MQITLGTQYNMSGRNHLKKNQNTPRPSEHPRVIKASTRMILVHVQKMYNIFRILIGVPDYSSSSLFLMKRKLSPPPPDKQNTPGILYRNTNTTGKKIKYNLFMAFKQVPRCR